MQNWTKPGGERHRYEKIGGEQSLAAVQDDVSA
jgi:hypothetical protein